MKNLTLVIALVCLIGIGGTLLAQTIVIRDNASSTSPIDISRQSFVGIRGLVPIREVSSSTYLLNAPTGYALFQYNSDDDVLQINLGTATGTNVVYQIASGTL